MHPATVPFWRGDGSVVVVGEVALTVLPSPPPRCCPPSLAEPGGGGGGMYEPPGALAQTYSPVTNESQRPLMLLFQFSS